MTALLVLLLALTPPGALARSVAVDVQKFPGDGVLSEARSVDVLEGDTIAVEFFGLGYANASGFSATLHTPDPSAIASVQGVGGRAFPVVLPGTTRAFSDSILVQAGALFGATNQGTLEHLCSVTFVAFDTVTVTLARVEFLGSQSVTDLASISLTINAAFIPLPAAIVRPIAIGFGTIRMGQSADSLLSIQNTGGKPLLVSLAGQSAPFALDSAALTVAGAGTGFVRLTFAPSDTGAFLDTLVVSTNDPLTPSVSVLLSGRSFQIAGALSFDFDATAGNQGQDTVTAAPGDTLTVELYGDLPNVTSYGTALAFGPLAAFVPSSFAAGPFLPGGTALVRASGDSVSIGVASFTQQTASGPGLLGTFRVALALSFADTTTIQTARLEYGLAAGGVDSKPYVATATIYKGEPGLLGDFDGDHRVGFSDFVLFAAAFGSVASDGPSSPFDLDSDGAVGFGDFILFAQAFGSTS